MVFNHFPAEIPAAFPAGGQDYSCKLNYPAGAHSYEPTPVASLFPKMDIV